MKIPKKIKIGGHWYVVKFPYKFVERVDVFGQIDHPSEEIRIAGVDSGGTPRAEATIAVTFLHETFHAIDIVTGQDMFVGPEKDKRCIALSEGLYQVFVDNPGLDFR